MILLCYDTGSKHVGEVVLHVEPGQRPRALLARHVDVAPGQEGLRAFAAHVLATGREYGVERVAVERVGGVGGGEGESLGAVRARATGIVGAGRVEGIVQGIAAALGLPCETYPPRTVRAGLRVDRADRAAYVREHVDGWEADPAPGSEHGRWYLHRVDACLTGMWDIDDRRLVKPKGPRAERKPRVYKPRKNPRERARIIARSAIGCTCGRNHVRQCPLYAGRWKPKTPIEASQ